MAYNHQDLCLAQATFPVGIDCGVCRVSFTLGLRLTEQPLSEMLLSHSKSKRENSVAPGNDSSTFCLQGICHYLSCFIAQRKSHGHTGGQCREIIYFDQLYNLSSQAKVRMTCLHRPFIPITPRTPSPWRTLYPRHILGVFCRMLFSRCPKRWEMKGFHG